MKVLVPVDFSKASARALQYSAQVFKAGEAELILLHSFVPLQGGFFDETTEEEENLLERQQLQTRLQHWAERFNTKKLPIARYEVVEGTPARTIVALARKQGVDLILMGTTGASGLREKLVGTTTAHVVHRAPCPVLAVPERYRVAALKNILFCTDYHFEDLQALRWLQQWPAAHRAHLHIVHFSNERAAAKEAVLQRDYEAVVKQVVGNDRVHVEVLPFEDFHVDLQKLSRRTSADLLVMMQRRRRWWQLLLEASHTRKVVYHARIPILTFPAT
ncbi:MAG: universal stress protein [Chitinophagales bacterium]|nr:universal stress protein [Chitinophagales bacterium]MDW8427929.1 universal stress protein [Chitinophagales bacterium]